MLLGCHARTGHAGHNKLLLIFDPQPLVLNTLGACLANAGASKTKIRSEGNMIKETDADTIIELASAKLLSLFLMFCHSYAAT